MNKDIKTGFKVVYSYNELYQSCIQMRGHGCIEYKLNEWVSRRKSEGPLAIFETLAYAKSFYIANFGFQYTGAKKRFKIFKCEYIPSYDSNLWYITYRFDLKMILSFLDFPNGTILADKVKLIEEIK